MTRREWATMLGSVCSPSFPTDAIEAIVDMLPLLADFADEAFTAETIKAVARAPRKQTIPDFGTVANILHEFRLQSLPVHQRMGGTVPVKQIVQQFVHDSDEVKAASLARAQTVIAELKGDQAGLAEKPKIEPKYFTKLQLALASPPAVLAIRPDLRAALQVHQDSDQQRQ